MDGLNDVFMATRKALYQFNEGQDINTIRETINEAVKHARHARIDFYILPSGFLDLARSYFKQNRTFGLAEGYTLPP